MRGLKKSVFGFFIGVVLLTPLDILQVHYRILEYPTPKFFQIAWWVPLAFGLSFLTIVWLFPYLEETLTATFTFKHRFIFLEFIAIILTFMGPIVTQSYPLLIVFLFSIYVLIRLGFFHAKWDWLFFLIGALVATTVEIGLTSFDLYHFTDPDFWGIPYWLPLEWGIAAMSGRRIAYVVEDLSRGRS
ncbi:MAG: hypothetical protein U1F57_04600 [bacterium]